MNVIAAVYNNSGPGGWSDPDLLIGPEVYVGGQSDEQARAQFSMWCLFPANLLISQNVLAWSPYALETYSNAEAIAVNQDALGSPAYRIVGGDLQFPCAGGGPSGAIASVQAVACDASDPSQKWSFDAATGAIVPAAFPAGVLDVFDCGTADGTVVSVYAPDGGAGPCAGKNQVWSWPGAASPGGGAVTSANGGVCLDVFDWTGPTVDAWACNGGSNQAFSLSAEGLIATQKDATHAPVCLSATVAPPPSQCTNVWGRQLSGGAFALGFVNNGGAAANVTCDAACFAQLRVPAGVTQLKVRDLWAHADLGTLSAPFSFTAPVNGTGFAALFKLTPA